MIAEIAGDQAQQHADDAGHHRAADGHQQGDPGAVEHAGQQVAAHVVGAEDVAVHAGLQEGLGGADGRGVIGTEQRRKHRDKDHRAHDDQADHGRFVSSQLAPGAVGPALALEQFLVGFGAQRVGDGLSLLLFFHHLLPPPS